MYSYLHIVHNLNYANHALHTRAHVIHELVVSMREHLLYTRTHTSSHLYTLTAILYMYAY